MTLSRDRILTLWALGPTNVLRVVIYRFLIRTRLHPVQRLKCSGLPGPFYVMRQTPAPPGAQARRDWRKFGFGFGHVAIPAGDEPPDWRINILNGSRHAGEVPWWRIPDFDGSVGDIKGIWEASRLDWLLAMSGRAALGDSNELRRLNRWISDWLLKNPPFVGPNWKCGQEASIRVMHLAAAAMMLDQVHSSQPALLALLRIHLSRIAPTMGYAVGQANNHGTSEAVALFVGGSWLAAHGDAAGRRWERIGRARMTERAKSLIASDGTFSQYSLVYHRLFMDCYALAESWRRALRLAPFPTVVAERLSAATRWLAQFVNPTTGDGPNIGANDGAHILRLEDSAYRDFRPSLQLSSALYLDCYAVPGEGAFNQRLIWFGVPRPAKPLEPPISQSFDCGGYHVLRQGKATAYLRYPRFRFRPSQADALHLDLWVNDEALLRDAGTFSYNSSDANHAYFSGAASHNMVMFDDADPMPRLGRFLFARWLKAEDVEVVRDDGSGSVTASAAYREYRGNRHAREVRLSEDRVEVFDELSGPASQAVLRWRLPPGDWRHDGNGISDGRRLIQVHDDQGVPVLLRLVTGAESLHYFERTLIPVIEVTRSVPAALRTIFRF